MGDLVIEMIEDPVMIAVLGTGMTADHPCVEMSEEKTEVVAEVGEVHPVMTAVDLTEDPVIVMIGVLVIEMIVVHLCVEMTVVTEMTEVVVEVGEVHPVMTADHQCVGMTVDLGMTEDPGMTVDLGIVMIVDHPVMTVEMEDSVEVIAIAVMIEDLVKTVVTTGVQDREDFHLHHVMTVVEVMT